MSTAELNIWITEPGRPCRITDNTFLVAIAHCNGEILEWDGREYVRLRADNGHLEVEVPPGCYHIRAARGIRFIGDIYLGNWLTESAIVEVSCDEEKCVRLYSPAGKTCGRLFTLALQQFGEQMGVDDDLLNETLGNLEELNAQLPDTGAIARRLEQYERLTEAAKEETGQENGKRTNRDYDRIREENEEHEE